MGTDIAILEKFKGGPAQAFKETAGQVERMGEGVGSSYAVLYYKGKNWSLGYRGERYNFVRPDDGTPLGYLDVIFLRGATHKSKSYYEGYDPNASEGKRPICSSLDSIVPDADIAQPQANACAICPKNQWRTNAEGKKVRDCSDYKRFAVLIVPSLTRPFFNGVALIEPVFLRIPGASLDPLTRHGDQMEALGFPMNSFVTRIKFDPNESHPKMVFSALQPLTAEEAPVILKLRDDPQSLRIVGADQVDGSPITQPMRLSHAPAKQIEAPKAAPVAQPAPVIQPQETPAPVGLGLADAGIPATSPKPIVVEGSGLGIAPGANGGGPAAVAVPTNGVRQTTEDTGTAVESDADLDARINAVLAGE